MARSPGSGPSRLVGEDVVDEAHPLLEAQPVAVARTRCPPTPARGAAGRRAPCRRGGPPRGGRRSRTGRTGRGSGRPPRARGAKPWGPAPLRWSFPSNVSRSAGRGQGPLANRGFPSSPGVLGFPRAAGGCRSVLRDEVRDGHSLRLVPEVHGLKRAPPRLTDVTHGICDACLERRARWARRPCSSSAATARARSRLLRTLLRGAPEIAIVVDRRAGRATRRRRTGHGLGRRPGPAARADRRRTPAFYVV